MAWLDANVSSISFIPGLLSVIDAFPYAINSSSIVSPILVSTVSSVFFQLHRCKVDFPILATTALASIFLLGSQENPSMPALG
jgi:hypothetical protein